MIMTWYEYSIEKLREAGKTGNIKRGPKTQDQEQGAGDKGKKRFMGLYSSSERMRCAHGPGMDNRQQASSLFLKVHGYMSQGRQDESCRRNALSWVNEWM